MNINIERVFIIINFLCLSIINTNYKSKIYQPLQANNSFSYIVLQTNFYALYNNIEQSKIVGNSFKITQ